MYLSQKSKYFASWNIEKKDICARVIQGYLVQVANLSSEEVRMIGDLLNENSWMYTALTEMLYEQANLNDNNESVSAHSVTTRAVTFYSKFEYSFEGGVKSSNSKCNSPFELCVLPSHKNFRPF